jgi:hypothetical protein
MCDVVPAGSVEEKNAYFNSGLATVAGSPVQLWRMASVWSEKNVRRPLLLKDSEIPREE